MAQDAPKVLIVVENLSVPFDRRPWREALSLSEAGHRVSVICPKGVDRDTASRETLEGVAIYRYRPLEASGGVLSYLIEYAHAVLAIFALSWLVWRDRGVDVVQLCNPPDLLFFAVWPFKLLGKKIVFDHHDLSPELYVAKSGGKPSSFVTNGLLALERATFRFADVVITANESYQEVALTRGRKKEGEVFVVRNGPELSRIRDVTPDPELRRGKQHLLVYVGMMATQDGVDYLLRAVRILATDPGRDDFHTLVIGDGPELPFLRRYAAELAIEDVVTFTGLVDDRDRIFTALATADVGVCPDPMTALNDRSTLIKVLEYMAVGKPVVAFDLTETRASAGAAALYVTPNDEREFAAAIARLLDSRELRERMGRVGRERFERRLAWDHSKEQLLAAYRSLGGV